MFDGSKRCLLHLLGGNCHNLNVGQPANTQLNSIVGGITSQLSLELLSPFHNLSAPEGSMPPSLHTASSDLA
jgi:hypothetical protein